MGFRATAGTFSFSLPLGIHARDVILRVTELQSSGGWLRFRFWLFAPEKLPGHP
jgi:hypothetical protein